MIGSDSGFADDIVPDELPVHLEPRREKFLPWHRVRKEFIRQHLWNALTKRRVSDSWVITRETPNETAAHTIGGEVGASSSAPVGLGTPLSCLVIPGDDLLDIRALRRDLGLPACHIRYLGFNESAGSDHVSTQVHVANNAVTSLVGVARDSRVLHDRFQSIAKPGTQAYRYLKEYGPYHVVNLDLCGSLFPTESADTQEYYTAIHNLLSYQFLAQTTKWLLFITTQVEPSRADIGQFAALCQPTRENYRRHGTFAERLKAEFPDDVFHEGTATASLAALAEEQSVSLFGIALGKWLMALGHGSEPKWTITMRHSYRYTIRVDNDRGVAMLSLAFEFERNASAPVDSAGVSSLRVSPKKYKSEAECALKLIELVGQMEDVDHILASDVQLRSDLLKSKADLLQASGYDRDKYLKWVDDGEIVT